ncbi:Hydrogenase-4 component A [Sporomusa carbonis]|uniref:4Fe-4S dicluster domain-containing protein n=1 Tax=Sporomusa carbonis TaxID=3076075 RepID=UPI003A618BF9
MNTFVVANPHKCIGCKACEIACAVAHLDNSVATAGALEAPFLPRLNLVRTPMVTMPIQCRQCDDAPCANVCPVNAITHQEDKIIVNTDKCIGCKTCMIACPLGAMDMVPELENCQPVYQEGLQLNIEGQPVKEKIVAHKCDLCVGREGGPACVEVCPASAFVIVKPADMKKAIKNRRAASAAEVACIKKAN